jgi:hypothetical protein
MKNSDRCAYCGGGVGDPCPRCRPVVEKAISDMAVLTSQTLVNLDRENGPGEVNRVEARLRALEAQVLRLIVIQAEGDMAMAGGLRREMARHRELIVETALLLETMAGAYVSRHPEDADMLYVKRLAAEIAVNEGRRK